MIKINLLPVRAARTKENIRRQVSIYLLCIVFSVVAMGYLSVSMSHKIGRLNTKIEDGNKELQKFQAIEKQVNKMKKELKKLNDKMNIIAKLDASRSGPVRIMDALTNVVVADKMWLTSLKQKTGKLTLDGIAVDNKTVADFMTSLEDSPYFQGVDLVKSQQKPMKQGKNFKQFSITCQALHAPPAKKSKAS